MAGIAPTGGTYDLYETEITFDQVIADLGLFPISVEEQERIRSELTVIHWRGAMEFAASKKYGKKYKLQIEDISATLEANARHLESVKQPLRGFQRGQQQFHDLEVARKIIEFLALNPEIGDEEKAEDFLNDFCNRVDLISEACMAAARHLKSVKGSAGRKQLVWFNDFIRILLPIAKQNQIPLTFETDRQTNEVRGRILDLVSEFERLFAPDVGMRSPSRGALAKRLYRALADI